MSLIVSRRPSFLNHSNEAFWMSIRLGRSSTCLRREKLLRARGAATRAARLGGPPYAFGGDGEVGRGAGASGLVAPRRSRTIDGAPAARQTDNDEGASRRPRRLRF